MSTTDEYGGDLPRKQDGVTVVPGSGCTHCPAAFYKTESKIAHIKEKHPNKPVPTSWEDSKHRIDYIPNFTPAHPHMYLLSDKQSGKYLSNMLLNEKGEVNAVETHPKYRRQGLAKKLWDIANTNAEQGAPAPVHSGTRTRAGEAWAKKVGGEVPPRTGDLLSSRQMTGMIDFKRQ